MKYYMVNLWLRGGQVVRFTAETVTTRRDLSGNLTELSCKGAPNFPAYIRLADVSVITTDEPVDA